MYYYIIYDKILGQTIILQATLKYFIRINKLPGRGNIINKIAVKHN